MKQKTRVLTLTVTAASLALVAAGCSSSNDDRASVENQAPADDLASKAQEYENQVQDFVGKDPNEVFNMELEKLAGPRTAKQISKFFKTKLHNDVFIHIKGAKRANVTIVKRKSGETVKRGVVRAKGKHFSLPRGKYRATAKQKKKSAAQTFRITKKHGANVLLHLR